MSAGGAEPFDYLIKVRPRAPPSAGALLTGALS